MPQDFYEKHLKVFPPEQSEIEQATVPFFASFPELAKTFQKVTGYQLKFAKPGTKLNDCAVTFPIQSRKDYPAHTLGLARNLTSMSLIPERDVEQLAQSLAYLLSEAYNWQISLRQREAELAANVQLTFHDQKNFGLAQRLETILKHGAKAVGCDAASLYLLDHETSLLKLRSIWGLPEERLTDPPRQLCTALADLEAMLGHAVILNDDFLTERWNTPEIFSSSVCVPVASSTTVHGTLWLFSNSHRNFDETALGFLEIVAGRIAIELERSTLLREGYDGMILKRQLTDAEHFLQNQLPTPVLEPNGWQFAGAIYHTKPLAATAYDWQQTASGKTIITILSTSEKVPSVEAQMRLVMLQTEMKQHIRHQRSLKQLVQEFEDIAFVQTSEKHPFEMLFGVLDKEKQQLRLSCSGSFLLLRFAQTKDGINAKENNKTNPSELKLQRVDHDFADAKPELAGFRMLRLSSNDGLIAIHLPLDSHHYREKILDALFSKRFLQEEIVPQLNGNASQIAEFLGLKIQQSISGTNITILVLKNATT